ncbi:periplasmic heavy metal sensor [Candidatus Phaeomarinobacter ectocarpi]|uniref:periplasmic heavy metal sensor n=1 Tax=Candidatus Phaeomarinibacter ectocarpi TaxID=1458461 RepID=UPI0005C493DF|nr:periplasmic heavy metal sensor [Candidatus Phaeomarinobacter ectocarpi]
MTDRTDPKTVGRWVKVILFASLAINLFFAGLLIGGPAFRDGPPKGGPGAAMMPNPRMFVEALGPREGRRVQREIRRSVPDLREKFKAVRANHLRVVAALRADPYDPQALTDALGNVREAHTELAASFQEPLATVFGNLTYEQRLKLADALEQMRPRPGRRPGGVSERPSGDDPDR